MLEAKGGHLLWGGAQEGDAGLLAEPGKVGVLAQETVAGVNGLGACLPRYGYHLVLIQIGILGGARAQWIGLVGAGHMQAVGIGLGIDGDGVDPHGLQGVNDAASDGAPVGDQDFGKHELSVAGRPALRC